MPSNIWRRPRRKRDSDKSKPLNNNLSTDKLRNSWWCEINKKKSLTSRSQRLKTKLLTYLLRRNVAKLKWSLPLKRADKTRSTARNERRKMYSKKSLSSPSSGNWETTNSQLLKCKKKTKKNKEKWRCRTTLNRRSLIKIERPRKTSWWSNTPLSETMLF
jgi:hypothetical protein